MAKRRMILTAPLASVALVALGAALWGTDGAFRQPLVATPARWSPYTIVLYEHVILTAVVAPYLIPRWRRLRRLDRGGWLAAFGVAWGGWFLAPALVGTYLLSFGTMAPADAFSGAQGKAALLALVAAALWGAATAFGRRTLVALEPKLVTAVRFTLALPLLLVIALY